MPSQRAIYKCRICNQPKKNHLCPGHLVQPSIQPVVDVYYTHCQICMHEYTSDNIKAGPEGSRSCHFCCTSCFTKVIKKIGDCTISYTCPWCRRKYIMIYDMSDVQDSLALNNGNSEEFARLWNLIIESRERA